MRTVMMFCALVLSCVAVAGGTEMPEQAQMALASADRNLSLTEQLRHLFTDHVLVVLGMVALGMVIGIAFAGGARLFKYRLDKALPQKEYDHHALMLKRVAFAAGTLWTFAILMFLIEASPAVRLIMAMGLAPCAGLGTPYMYDLLKWIVATLIPAIGKWLLEWVKAQFAALVAKFKGPPS